jgi:hypothetical protein
MLINFLSPQELNIYSSRKNFFRMIMIHKPTFRLGLKKVQWNIEFSIKHYKPWGSYTESSNNHWLFLRPFKGSKEFKISRMRFRYIFWCFFLKCHLWQVCSKINGTLIILLSTLEHSQAQVLKRPFFNMGFIFFMLFDRLFALGVLGRSIERLFIHWEF